MTAEEVGAYIRLLCHQWNKGGLPNDDSRLSLMAGQCQASAIAHAKTKFRLCDDGQLRNSRLEAERDKQSAYREKQASNGAKRWLGNAKPHAVAMPSLMPNVCSPSPSPSPKEEEGREPSAPAAARPPSLLPAIKEVFEAWNKLAGIPRCLVLSDARRRKLESRLRDPFFVANWRFALNKVQASPFCRGENDRGWRASFDWFLQPDVCVKVMEGKYSGKLAPPRARNGDYSESPPSNASIILAELAAEERRNKPPEPLRPMRLEIVKE